MGRGEGGVVTHMPHKRCTVAWGECRIWSLTLKILDSEWPWSNDTALLLSEFQSVCILYGKEESSLLVWYTNPKYQLFQMTCWKIGEQVNFLRIATTFYVTYYKCTAICGQWSTVMSGHWNILAVWIKLWLRFQWISLIQMRYATSKSVRCDDVCVKELWLPPPSPTSEVSPSNRILLFASFKKSRYIPVPGISRSPLEVQGGPSMAFQKSATFNLSFYFGPWWRGKKQFVEDWKMLDILGCVEFRMDTFKLNLSSVGRCERQFLLAATETGGLMSVYWMTPIGHQYIEWLQLDTNSICKHQSCIYRWPQCAGGWLLFEEDLFNENALTQTKDTERDRDRERQCVCGGGDSRLFDKPCKSQGKLILTLYLHYYYQTSRLCLSFWHTGSTVHTDTLTVFWRV